MKRIKLLIFSLIFITVAIGVYSVLEKQIINKKVETELAKIQIVAPKVKEKPVAAVDNKHLDLSNSGLTQIPAEELLMKELIELDISGNRLSGSLPSEIKQLENLRILKAANNQMTGLPAEISQLKNLELLDISNNQIIGLPYELSNLKNLRTLNLTGNKYSALDFDIISKEMPNTNFIVE